MYHVKGPLLYSRPEIANANVTENLKLFPPMIEKDGIFEPIRDRNHRIHCRPYSGGEGHNNKHGILATQFQILSSYQKRLPAFILSR